MDSIVLLAVLLLLAAVVLGAKNLITIINAIKDILHARSGAEQKRKEFYAAHMNWINSLMSALEYFNVHWKDLMDDEKINAKQSKLYLERALEIQDTHHLNLAMQYAVKAGWRTTTQAQEQST